MNDSAVVPAAGVCLVGLPNVVSTVPVPLAILTLCSVLAKNCIPYAGPFPLSVQELDGATKHVVQVEENTIKYDVVCHSKTRRHKKKRTPIWTGEEMDIDLNDADPDCPVLWIKYAHSTDQCMVRSFPALGTKSCDDSGWTRT